MTIRAAAWIVLGTAVASIGATNVDPVLRYSWGENIGWIAWRDGDAGVRVHATILSGYAWGENVGWIHLGDGTPVNGTAYANADGSDSGVNIDPATGNLSGLAWGENIGWINFDTAAALGGSGQHARLDAAARRLRGYAWGENVGWINLDDAVVYVAWVQTPCATPFANTDGDLDVDHDDFGVFQTCFSGPGRPAHSNCECFDRPEAGFPRGDNDVDGDDFKAFSGCRSGPGIAARAGC